LPPWFGPILNLTCALDDERCEVLQWIVDHVPEVPTKPHFVWRYALEAAVEAAAFAPPGRGLTESVQKLLNLACNALSLRAFPVKAKMPLDIKIPCESRVRGIATDLVTEISLLRSIEALARLQSASGRIALSNDATLRFSGHGEASLFPR
jgi:hypothetical protein